MKKNSYIKPPKKLVLDITSYLCSQVDTYNSLSKTFTILPPTMKALEYTSNVELVVEIIHPEKSKSVKFEANFNSSSWKILVNLPLIEKSYDNLRRGIYKIISHELVHVYQAYYTISKLQKSQLGAEDLDNYAGLPKIKSRTPKYRQDKNDHILHHRLDDREFYSRLEDTINAIHFLIEDHGYSQAPNIIAYVLGEQKRPKFKDKFIQEPMEWIQDLKKYAPRKYKDVIRKVKKEFSTSQRYKTSDFYREVSPPDSLSSMSTGTPSGKSKSPKGEDASSLPNGDSARNIGRPGPDSPNLKTKNLDRSESYGRTPAEGFDGGYVHDSGSGSARVIPYDSSFTNNSSPLRKASKRVVHRYLEARMLTQFTNWVKGDSDLIEEYIAKLGERLEKITPSYLEVDWEYTGQDDLKVGLSLIHFPLINVVRKTKVNLNAKAKEIKIKSNLKSVFEIEDIYFDHDLKDLFGTVNGNDEIPLIETLGSELFSEEVLREYSKVISHLNQKICLHYAHKVIRPYMADHMTGFHVAYDPNPLPHLNLPHGYFKELRANGFKDLSNGVVISYSSGYRSKKLSSFKFFIEDNALKTEVSSGGKTVILDGFLDDVSCLRIAWLGMKMSNKISLLREAKMNTRISGLIRPPQNVLDEVAEAVRSLLAYHVLENAKGDKSFPITTEELVELNDAAESILMSIGPKDLADFNFLIREYKKILKGKKINRDLAQMIKEALVFLSQGKSQLKSNGDIEEEVFDEIEMALDNVQGEIESRLGYMSYIELSDIKEFENYRRLLNQHPYHQIDEFSYATSLDDTKDTLELPLLIHVEFIDDANKAEKNPAGYWESNGYHNIIFRFPKEPVSTSFLSNGTWNSSYFDKIMDSARHELVHVMQQEIEVEQNIVEKGGFPSKSRGTKYRQKMKEQEKLLKDEYRRKGLDPNLVNFHSLDDIEFYSILLDEVVKFERDFNFLYRGRHTNEDVNKEVKKAIKKRPFFKSLKQFQRKKWNKAVGIFFKEIKEIL